MTILEAAAALRAGRTSSKELVYEALRRVSARNPRLNAFITVMEDSARVAAENADLERARGLDRGPLHGIPVAVKDVFCTRGVRTTAGSKLFERHVPDHNAAVVDKLLEAGAVLLGKTNMHELAYGITSNNPHFGTVHNPWDLDRIPGGSSGGSGAAVASGLAYMAMGTDTGGSIRIPASFCGTVGLKPTLGRVSRYGVLPLDFTLDHMGPLTRTVRDAAVVLEALAGHDPRDESSSREPVEKYLPGPEVSLAGVRVGLPENFYFDRVQREAAGAVRAAAKAAESLGAAVVPVRVPDMAAINTVGRVIVHAEASAIFERWLGEGDRFGADVLALLQEGRFVSATDYINAQRLRRIYQQQFGALWKQVECIFTPTTPTSAPKIGQAILDIGGEDEDVRLATTRLVRALNVLGLPALSLPCGFDANRLPLGLQIVAPAFQEAALLRIAAAVEDALGLAGTQFPGA